MERKKKEKERKTKKIRAPNNGTDLKYPTFQLTHNFLFRRSITPRHKGVHARIIISTRLNSRASKASNFARKTVIRYRRGLKGGRDDVRWNNDFCE